MSTFDTLTYDGQGFEARPEQTWAAEGYSSHNEWLDAEHRRLFETPDGNAELRQAISRRNAMENIRRRRMSAESNLLWEKMNRQFEESVRIEEVPDISSVM